MKEANLVYLGEGVGQGGKMSFRFSQLPDLPAIPDKPEKPGRPAMKARKPLFLSGAKRGEVFQCPDQDGYVEALLGIKGLCRKATEEDLKPKIHKPKAKAAGGGV